MTTPGREGRHGLFRSFRDELDRTVRAVAHPAGDPEPPGLVTRVHAETDALDRAVDDEMGTNTHGRTQSIAKLLRVNPAHSSFCSVAGLWYS